MGQGDRGGWYQAGMMGACAPLSSIGNFRPIRLHVCAWSQDARGMLMNESPHRTVLLRTAAGVAAALLAASFAVGPALAGNATLNLVMVLDGLRPDSITADETPNLWRLRHEGVTFL